MGQKIHPNSLRLSFIQQNFIFKVKRFSFFKYSLITYIYNPATVNHKAIYSDKTVVYNQIKQIIDFYISKYYCFVNSYYISDFGYSLLIYVEFFQYKKQVNNFNLLFNYLQKHLSCIFLKKRPIYVFFKNINSVVSTDTIDFINFTKRFPNNLQGSEALAMLGCVSINIPAAAVFAKIIAYVLEKNINHQAVFDLVNNLFSFLYECKPNMFKGLRFQLKGRINGVDMAKKQTITYGSVPIQTISCFINYGFAPAFTPYGTCSVKVYICYNNKNALKT